LTLLLLLFTARATTLLTLLQNNDERRPHILHSCSALQHKPLLMCAVCHCGNQGGGVKLVIRGYRKEGCACQNTILVQGELVTMMTRTTARYLRSLRITGVSKVMYISGRGCVRCTRLLAAPALEPQNLQTIIAGRALPVCAGEGPNRGKGDNYMCTVETRRPSAAAAALDARTMRAQSLALLSLHRPHEALALRAGAPPPSVRCGSKIRGRRIVDVVVGEIGRCFRRRRSLRSRAPSALLVLVIVALQHNGLVLQQQQRLRHEGHAVRRKLRNERRSVREQGADRGEFTIDLGAARGRPVPLPRREPPGCLRDERGSEGCERAGDLLLRRDEIQSAGAPGRKERPEQPPGPLRALRHPRYEFWSRWWGGAGGIWPWETRARARPGPKNSVTRLGDCVRIS